MGKKLRLFLILSSFFVYLLPTYAEVVTYPLPSCYTSSGYWGVKVNNITIPVARYAPLGPVQYYFAHVSASGDNVYEIEAFETVNNYTISPTSYGIPAVKNGTKLTFSVSQSRYLQIKINSRSILYLLIDPIEENIPLPSASGIFDITAVPYSADNTGATDVTAKIQQTVDYASNAGGGTVYFPEGVYMCGTINLKTNVNIYLKGGAALMATSDKSKFGTNPNPAHIIKATNVNNVKIYGRGSIYCRGVLMNNNVRKDADGTFRVGPIQFANVNNCSIEGLTNVESTAWTLTFDKNTRNSNIKNFKILNEMTWAWNDGINMISSNNISVSHCFISTADDAACIKTQNFPKVNPGTPAFNITYDDIVCKSGISSGFKVGLQAEDDVYNIWAKNFEVLDCERAFNIDHWNGNGYWRDIHFVDWNVELMTGSSTSITKGKYVDCPFRIEISQEASSTYEVGVGKVTDIEITRVKFNAFGANDSYFWGYDANNNIDRVTITDLYFGNTLVLNNAAGNMQHKAFVSNVTYYKSADATLPVSVLSFTAKAQNNEVKLDWNTASEQNNERFIIARSADGKIFYMLNTIKGNGTTPVPHFYSILDKSPLGGQNYYRLSQVDLNGESKELGVRDVIFNLNSSKATQIYPNPVNSTTFNILLKDKSASEISIFNSTGSKVFYKLFENKEQNSLITINSPQVAFCRSL